MDDVQKQSWNPGEHHPASEDSAVNLLDYLKVVFKYRRMIVCLCVVAVILTATISFLRPKVYSATTLIVPPMEFLQMESELAGGLGGGKSSLLRKAINVVSIGDIYVGILKSRAVTDVIVDKFDLMRVSGKEESLSDARRVLKTNTNISVSNEGIVSITVKDNDPNRAAAIANAYVEELDRENKRLSAGQATSKKVFLENRLKEVESRLSKIDDILSREAKMQEMLFELLTREYEIAKIEEAKSMPTIQVLDKAIVPEMRDARGTISKSIVAGVGVFMFAIFAAFAREYFVRMRNESGRDRLLLDQEQDHVGDESMEELESKRRIIGARRRKSSQNSQLYQPKT